MSFKKLLAIIIVVFAAVLTVVFILFQGKMFKQPESFSNVSLTEKQKVIFNIDIKNYNFSPKEAKIKAGTTVVWTNQDPISHSVKIAQINSGDLKKGQSFEYTFAIAGEYEYFCGLHPSMQGTVTVEP